MGGEIGGRHVRVAVPDALGQRGEAARVAGESP
jgi:hypothetical protein